MTKELAIRIKTIETLKTEVIKETSGTGLTWFDLTIMARGFFDAYKESACESVTE